jgi:hypothetical protein
LGSFELQSTPNQTGLDHFPLGQLMAGEKRWICVGAVIQIRFAFVGATLSGAAAMFTLALDNIALPVVVLPAAPTIKTVTVNKDNAFNFDIRSTFHRSYMQSWRR